MNKKQIIILNSLPDNICNIEPSNILYVLSSNSWYFSTHNGLIRLPYPEKGLFGDTGHTGHTGGTGAIGAGLTGFTGATGGTGSSGTSNFGSLIPISTDPEVLRYIYYTYLDKIGDCHPWFIDEENYNPECPFIEPDPLTIADDTETTFIKYYHNCGTKDIIIEARDINYNRILIQSHWIIEITDSYIILNSQYLKYLSQLSNQYTSNINIYLKITPIRDYINLHYHTLYDNFHYLILGNPYKSTPTPATYHIGRIHNSIFYNTFEIIYFIDINGNDITYTLDQIKHSSYVNGLNENSLYFQLTQSSNSTSSEANCGYLIYRIYNEIEVDKLLFLGNTTASIIDKSYIIPSEYYGDENGRLRVAIPFHHQFFPIINHNLNHLPWLKPYFNKDNIEVRVKIYPYLPNLTHNCKDIQHCNLLNQNLHYINLMDYDGYPHNNIYHNATIQYENYDPFSWCEYGECPNANIQNDKKFIQWLEPSYNIKQQIDWYNCASPKITEFNNSPLYPDVNDPTLQGIYYDYKFSNDDSSIELIFFKCSRAFPKTIYATGILEVYYDLKDVPPLECERNRQLASCYELAPKYDKDGFPIEYTGNIHIATSNKDVLSTITFPEEYKPSPLPKNKIFDSYIEADKWVKQALSNFEGYSNTHALEFTYSNFLSQIKFKLNLTIDNILNNTPLIDFNAPPQLINKNLLLKKVNSTYDSKYYSSFDHDTQYYLIVYYYFINHPNEYQILDLVLSRDNVKYKHYNLINFFTDPRAENNYDPDEIFPYWCIVHSSNFPKEESQYSYLTDEDCSIIGSKNYSPSPLGYFNNSRTEPAQGFIRESYTKYYKVELYDVNPDGTFSNDNYTNEEVKNNLLLVKNQRSMCPMEMQDLKTGEITFPSNYRYSSSIPYTLPINKKDFLLDDNNWNDTSTSISSITLKYEIKNCPCEPNQIYTLERIHNIIQPININKIYPYYKNFNLDRFIEFKGRYWDGKGYNYFIDPGFWIFDNDGYYFYYFDSEDDYLDIINDALVDEDNNPLPRYYSITPDSEQEYDYPIFNIPGIEKEDHIKFLSENFGVCPKNGLVYITDIENSGYLDLDPEINQDIEDWYGIIESGIETNTSHIRITQECGRYFLLKQEEYNTYAYRNCCHIFIRDGKELADNREICIHKIADIQEFILNKNQFLSNLSTNKVYQTKITRQYNKKFIHIVHNTDIGPNDIFSVQVYSYDCHSNKMVKFDPDHILRIDNNIIELAFNEYSKVNLCHYDPDYLERTKTKLQILWIPSTSILSKTDTYFFITWYHLHYIHNIPISLYSTDPSYYPDNRPDLPPNRYNGQKSVDKMDAYFGYKFYKVHGTLDKNLKEKFFSLYTDFANDSFLMTSKTTTLSLTNMGLYRKNLIVYTDIYNAYPKIDYLGALEPYIFKNDKDKDQEWKVFPDQKIDFTTGKILEITSDGGDIRPPSNNYSPMNSRNIVSNFGNTFDTSIQSLGIENKVIFRHVFAENPTENIRIPTDNTFIYNEDQIVGILLATFPVPGTNTVRALLLETKLNMMNPLGPFSRSLYEPAVYKRKSTYHRYRCSWSCRAPDGFGGWYYYSTVSYVDDTYPVDVRENLLYTRRSLDRRECESVHDQSHSKKYPNWWYDCPLHIPFEFVITDLIDYNDNYSIDKTHNKMPTFIPEVWDTKKYYARWVYNNNYSSILRDPNYTVDLIPTSDLRKYGINTGMGYCNLTSVIEYIPLMINGSLGNYTDIDYYDYSKKIFYGGYIGCLAKELEPLNKAYHEYITWYRNEHLYDSDPPTWKDTRIDVTINNATSFKIKVWTPKNGRVPDDINDNNIDEYNTCEVNINLPQAIQNVLGVKQTESRYGYYTFHKTYYMPKLGYYVNNDGWTLNRSLIDPDNGKTEIGLKSAVRIHDGKTNQPAYSTVITEDSICIYDKEDKLINDIPTITKYCSAQEMISDPEFIYNPCQVYVFNYQHIYPDLTDFILKFKYFSLPDNYSIETHFTDPYNLRNNLNILTGLYNKYYPWKQIVTEELKNGNITGCDTNYQPCRDIINLELTDLNDLQDLSNYYYNGTYYNVLNDEPYPIYGERFEPDCVDIEAYGWISKPKKLPLPLYITITNHSKTVDSAFNQFINEYKDYQAFYLNNKYQYLSYIDHNLNFITSQDYEVKLYDLSGIRLGERQYYLKYGNNRIEIIPYDLVVKEENILNTELNLYVNNLTIDPYTVNYKPLYNDPFQTSSYTPDLNKYIMYTYTPDPETGNITYSFSDSAWESVKKEFLYDNTCNPGKRFQYNLKNPNAGFHGYVEVIKRKGEAAACMTGGTGGTGYLDFSDRCLIRKYIGFTGATGGTGYTGSTGGSGEMGGPGPTGGSGGTGYTGGKGGTGPQGRFTTYYQKDKVYSGGTGKTGFWGKTGGSGGTGYSGQTGPTGYRGATGYTGGTGRKDITGKPGPTGPTGATGGTGGSGYTGYTGCKGISVPYNPDHTLPELKYLLSPNINTHLSRSTLEITLKDIVGSKFTGKYTWSYSDRAAEAEYQMTKLPNEIIEWIDDIMNNVHYFTIHGTRLEQITDFSTITDQYFDITILDSFYENNYSKLNSISDFWFDFGSNRLFINLNNELIDGYFIDTLYLTSGLKQPLGYNNPYDLYRDTLYNFKFGSNDKYFIITSENDLIYNNFPLEYATSSTTYTVIKPYHDNIFTFKFEHTLMYSFGSLKLGLNIISHVA